MGKESVLLLSMPWEELQFPSIQLGILQAVLDRAGISVAVRSMKLDFLDYCAAATADAPGVDRLGLDEYGLIVEWSRDVNLGDWIFSVPPFQDRPDADRQYLDFLRAWPVPERDIAVAMRFRRLVPAFLDQCVAEVLSAAPRLVGLTTGADQFVASLVLSKLVKARAPWIKVVLGGANCQGPMGAAAHRAFPWVDAVVRGEGEEVLPPLAEDLIAGRPPRRAPGLCLREGQQSVAIPEEAGTVPMDSVPVPNYDEYFARLERASHKPELDARITLFYESARGCWWGAKSHCAFCGISDLAMPYRSKSPHRVVDELDALTRRYGQRRVFLVDYILDWRYFRDVLPRLRDLGHDLHMFCETKANLRKGQVRLLREAGFVAVQAGVESLSDPILRLMKKGVSAFQNVRLIKWCAELGIRLYWNIIYGIPGEPPGEYARMADAMRSLVHLEPPRIVPLALDRFSPYHERHENFGLEVIGPRRDYRFIYPELDDATLNDLAYTFEYRQTDGCNPAAYAEPVVRVVEAWREKRDDALGTLRWRKDGDGLVVTDRRPGLAASEYRLDGAEAAIYLASGDGASLDEIWEAAREAEPSLSRSEVQDYLDELTEARLVYADKHHYLALALSPTQVPEPGTPADLSEQTATLTRCPS